MSNHRATNTDDSDEDDYYWSKISGKDDADFWTEAGNLSDSQSNSPVKEGSFSFPTVPETPTSRRLANTMQESLMLRSGGPRSSNVARSNGSASEQQDPFVVPSTPPPAQRTRSDVYSVPAKVPSNKQPKFPGRTPSTPFKTPMAAGSRSDILNRTYRPVAALPESPTRKSATANRTPGPMHPPHLFGLQTMGEVQLNFEMPPPGAGLSTVMTAATHHYNLANTHLQQGLGSNIFRPPGPSRPTSQGRSEILGSTLHPDSEDLEMDEVEGLIETDTESSIAPSTRQNSTNSLFPSSSGMTSTTSLTTTGSFSSDTHDLSGSRKRSFGDSGASTSNPVLGHSPPKIRRTVDTLHTPSHNGTELNLSREMSTPNAITRSATMPLATSQRMYPAIVDEESPFRIKASASAATPLRIRAPATSLPAVPQLPHNNSVPEPRTPLRKRAQRVPLAPLSPVPIPSTSSSVPLPTSLPSVPSGSTTGKPTPPSDLSFLKDAEGVDTLFHIVSSNQKVQKMMDGKRIAWGVQYELARGTTCRTSSGELKWTWADVTAGKLDQLRGSNAASAWKVPYVMLGKEVPLRGQNLDIWEELDREQKALLEEKGRGLGLMGKWEGIDNWYGGQIQQILRIHKEPHKKPHKKPSEYYVTIERLEKTRSHRFGRFLTSRRVGQVRVDSQLLQKEREDIVKFLTQNFVICGRMFRPFTSKEDSVYMVETDLNHERNSSAFEGDHLRMSYGDFIQWHNPLDRNWKQAISKWAARWALGLSTSRPVLEFEEANIHQIPDICSVEPPPGEKVAAENILTDGCGLINEAALTVIFKSGVVNLAHRPIAVQGRIGGAKGMWVLHPHNNSPAPEIWIRDSQKKIDLPTPLGRSHRIFELLCPSRVVTPSHLNMQVISNMSYNRVPDEAFTSLINEDLEKIVKTLTNWKAPHAMIGVAKAVHEAGRISGTRLQRVAPGNTRALGLGRDFHRDDEPEGNAEGDHDLSKPGPPPTYSGRCNISQAPIAIHENAYELLVAGFHPLKLEHLHTKMKKITTLAIDSSVKTFHIAVPESVEAFILPDPTGLLPPGQIYFCSSQSLTNHETGSIFNTVLGEVIVGRNPTRLPSDLQKVTAVDCPALHGYYDTILFSTQGERSLASLLAGGDYDGDTAMLFWAKVLVEHFKNSPISELPTGLQDEMFFKDIKSVTKFSQELAAADISVAQQELQKLALSGLVDSKVGLLSNYHDIAVYKYGYGSQEAQRVAHIFNLAMDAQKGGLRFDPVGFKSLRDQYRESRPKCMVPELEGTYIIADKAEPAIRSPSLTAFVLDTLVKKGEGLREKHIQVFDNCSSNLVTRHDPDLLKPYREAKQRAAAAAEEDGYYRYNDELEALRQHIDDVYTVHQRFWAKSPCKPATNQTRKASPSDSPSSHIALQFANGPEGHSLFRTQNLASIKASYAYTAGTPFFAFSVAFRDLCAIKAEASDHVPTARFISEAMSIRSSFVRVYEERTGDF